MKRLAMFFLAIFVSLSMFGQGKKKDQDVEIINHEVQLGESVRLISKKYLVDPAEIYKLNKFAVEGISQGMVLKIPVPKKEGAVIQQEENSERPETISQSDTEKVIQEKKPETKADETIVPAVPERAGPLNHTVGPKETLYSLSKKYGVTVEALEANNPQISKGLKTGQVIKIPGVFTETELVENHPADNHDSQEVITHKVAPKETLYSLSKKYNVTVDEIKQQNEVILQNGLQTGQVLTIRKN